jgi:opacity protein-like surface antigen
MRLLTMFFLFPILSVTLLSQTEEIPSLRGKKALIFTFSGLNLGGGLGGKYWLTDELSIRAAMDLSTSSSEADDRISSDPSSELRESNSTIVSCTVALFHTFLASETIQPYYGLGGGVNIESWDWKTVTAGGASTSYKSNGRKFHITAMIGTEIWITKNISLAGEQTLVFSSNIAITGENASGHRLYSGISALLLSVYLQ